MEASRKLIGFDIEASKAPLQFAVLTQDTSDDKLEITVTSTSACHVDGATGEFFVHDGHNEVFRRKFENCSYVAYCTGKDGAIVHFSEPHPIPGTDIVMPFFEIAAGPSFRMGTKVNRPDIRQNLIIHGLDHVRRTISNIIDQMQGDGFNFYVIAYRQKDVIIPCDQPPLMQTIVFSEIAMAFFKS